MIGGRSSGRMCERVLVSGLRGGLLGTVSICVLCLSILGCCLGIMGREGPVGLGRESGRRLLCLWDLLHFLVHHY
jgi:hypothetical protein